MPRGPVPVAPQGPLGRTLCSWVYPEYLGDGSNNTLYQRFLSYCPHEKWCLPKHKQWEYANLNFKLNGNSDLTVALTIGTETNKISVYLRETVLVRSLNGPLAGTGSGGWELHAGLPRLPPCVHISRKLSQEPSPVWNPGTPAWAAGVLNCLAEHRPGRGVSYHGPCLKLQILGDGKKCICFQITVFTACFRDSSPVPGSCSERISVDVCPCWRRVQIHWSSSHSCGWRSEERIRCDGEGKGGSLHGARVVPALLHRLTAGSVSLLCAPQGH